MLCVPTATAAPVTKPAQAKVKVIASEGLPVLVPQYGLKGPMHKIFSPAQQMDSGSHTSSQLEHGCVPVDACSI